MVKYNNYVQRLLTSFIISIYISEYSDKPPVSATLPFIPSPFPPRITPNVKLYQGATKLKMFKKASFSSHIMVSASDELE